MEIACLAWGSLVWSPRTLPHSAPFREDGPELPIEFSRVSTDGRVTLVIDSNAPLVRTLWAPLNVVSLDGAIEALGRRENIAPEHWVDWVGRHQLGDPAPLRGPLAGMDDWLVAHSLDALVWTALPSRLPDGLLEIPSLETLVTHLASLSGSARERAEEYVRRTPPSVRTPHRARFESEFGWLPSTSG